LTSTFLAIFVTPSLYTLLDDLQGLFFRPPRVAAPVPAERVQVPTPTPVPAATTGGVLVATGGGNGHNGNGHGVEPTWLQKLRMREFDDD
ncbi:MAG: hypothetical protein JOZ87_02450, partial [Chloroflexi bacterium]|nr:hypothetical protein [Chloroflexota bacterium]